VSEPLLAGQTGTAGSDIVDLVEITEAALPQAEAIGAPARSDDDMLAPMLATPAHAWASLDTQIAAGGVVKQEAVEPNPEMAQLAKISQRMCRARAALDKKRREKAGLGLPVDSSALLALPLVLPRLPSPAAAAAPAAAAPVLIPPFKTALEVAPVERAPATDEGELTAATLEQMGFEAAAVAAAMQQNGGDATRALERLLAVDEAEQSQAAATRGPSADASASPPTSVGPSPSVGVPHPVSCGKAPSTEGSEDGGPSLDTLVACLEQRLGVSGGVLVVVDGACEMLDLPKRRGTVQQRAMRCWEKLGCPDVLALPEIATAVIWPTARPSDGIEPLPTAESASGAGSSSSAPAAGSSSQVAPVPWSCGACTFFHESPADMGFLACALCATPKP